jgi:uncharacterized protein (TIGR02598 family)
MKKLPAAAAFSLVEVTLALGIAAFCLIAVFGLMPIGVQTNRNATSQTAATNVMAAVIADLRATPKTATTSTQFTLGFSGCAPPNSVQLYFNSEGQLVGRCDCCSDTAGSRGTNPRYRVGVTYPTSSAGLPYLDLKVTWPAAASSAAASGSVETLAAFDRN